jgi:pimeloyl-ACP methyl ester carboxylesterase
MKRFEKEKKSFVAIDFPWFWLTPLPKWIWWVREYCLFLKSALEKLWVKKATFISHSFGWRVLIYLNNLYPEKVEKNIFIASAWIKPEFNKIKLAIIKLWKWIFKIPWLKKIWNKIRNKVASRDYLASWELQQIFLKTINEDLKEKIKNIQADSLLIRGDKDSETPIEDWRWFNKNIKNSELLELKWTHFIYLEEPEIIFNNINKFLEK